MRRETRLLRTKAIDSLVLSIEHFNRPFDRGRQDAVLILLDHSFEMLLKAAILHRGAKIRKPGENQTLGFDECVRKALSDGDIQFLQQEEALLLQTINGLRDAAQHHLVELAEALVPEGTPGASVVAIKRVNELDFYNLGRDQLASKVGLTGPKATAVIEYLSLKDDEECFKSITIGKAQFGRYSQKAIDRVKQALGARSIEEIWAAYRRGERAG